MSIDRSSVLPRLLYLADVPVEASYHGSSLMYRLLQGYPSERLAIVEGNLLVSEKARRLPGIEYEVLNVGHRRLLHTRFAPWYSSFLTMMAAIRANRVEDLLGAFVPQAVLTVAHGYTWITAAALAARHRVPLHLVCHDDWPSVANILPVHRRKLGSVFGAIYRQAASRFCVSPAMRDRYKDLYNANGRVLYPLRASDGVVYDGPPSRLADQPAGLTIAFAGTVNSGGYVRALRAIAASLARIGGRLLIYGPLSPADAGREGLDMPNVEIRGLVTSGQLMSRLRTEADVLFVPMSFASVDEVNMKMGFPSKLADYTAVGVPLLIYGPPYCSAVVWAKKSAGIAETVECESPDALNDAVRRLATSSDARMTLGRNAIDAGNRYFGNGVVRGEFEQAITLLPNDARSRRD